MSEIKVGDMVCYVGDPLEDNQERLPAWMAIGMVISPYVYETPIRSHPPRTTHWIIEWFNWGGEEGCRQQNTDSIECVRRFKKNYEQLIREGL